ncbi:uncharacterized protein LOC117823226 [Notolabrus celidotus]|uniref:uncharacterized protein LOC117823226 n=1 Tax=Notolabrus celidotus TaxID=1203425 RepID=UPI0014901242|nr:uncharacterized protein LOC117823226 [Notolabrus celidotus]
MCPAWCRLLKAFCSGFEELLLKSCCSTALGTLQIMVGLFNIGLGPGRTSIVSGDLASLGAAYWLGGVFIVTGILSILAGQFPSRVLVGFTVFMNIAAAIFAITGIVLYAIDLRDASLLWLCDRSRSSADRHHGDNCRAVALRAQTLLKSMDTMMIALAMLQLSVCVILTILGIKALISEMKKEKLMDRNSMLPPVCQILKALCYSPTGCSIKSGMMQTGVTTALGTIQIMVGLFSIGLGPGRTSQHPRDFTYLRAAYWLGGVFLVSGLTSVLAGRFSYVCSVGFTVFMNILGSIFSIIGIVLYSIDLRGTITTDYCRGPDDDSCYYMAQFFRRLMTGMDITMLVLTVLQLCVCISFAVLGIKALINRKTEEDGKSAEDQWPQLEKVLLTSSGVLNPF